MKDNNIKENILREIEKGSIEMKPKAYFVLKTLAVATGIIIATIVVLFLVSFIAFVARAQGLWAFSEFGLRGILPLLLSLPWLLITAVLFLVFILEILARYFAFVYRKPMVYSILGILIFTIFAGGAIAATPLHKKMYERPFVADGSLYKHFEGKDSRGGLMGVVTEISEAGLTLTTPSGRNIFVATTSSTAHMGRGLIESGSTVFVLGPVTENMIEAKMIKYVSETNSNHMFKRGGLRKGHPDAPIMK